MPPLEALAADLLALLEAPAPCAARDREPGTAGPRAVPAAVPAGPARNSQDNNDLQKPGPLGPLGPQKYSVASVQARAAAVPATAADVLALHGPLLLGQVLVAEVLAHADPADLDDFHTPDDPTAGLDALEGFAAVLIEAGAVRPLPDLGLPPLARLAAELADEPGELRAWLDRTGPGRALRVRLEREPGACTACLLALRADPAGGLLAVRF